MKYLNEIINVLGMKTIIIISVSILVLILVILLSADFFIPMRQLGSFFHIAMNGMAASDKIFLVSYTFPL